VNSSDYPVQGAGLGLRRALMGPLLSEPPEKLAEAVQFMEVAPENWINVGGRFGRRFREFTEQYPFLCHGLSLSLGGPSPLDETFLHRLKKFLDEHQIRGYTEHLSYCTDEGHMYDLMPIPFTDEAVKHVVGRIKRTQDILERPIGIENVSYYAAPGAELSEIDFINAVLEEADCGLLLDVNNIYVNSVNHSYDPLEFLQALPPERIMYCHIAGHFNEADDLIIDTHGASVIGDVWNILAHAYRLFGVFPTLLERDFNFPPMDELLAEVKQISDLQHQYAHQAVTGHSRKQA
jgi:uncharacterized protein (UPF0276 family)